MQGYVNVYYDGGPLVICEEVAKAMKLEDGYRIPTEELFWEILATNAYYSLALIEKEVNDKAKGQPDSGS